MASLNTCYVTFLVCIMAQIAKPFMRLVATNLAVHRRENEPINVCVRRALCFADSPGFKPNVRNLAWRPEHNQLHIFTFNVETLIGHGKQEAWRTSPGSKPFTSWPYRRPNRHRQMT